MFYISKRTTGPSGGSEDQLTVFVISFEACTCAPSQSAALQYSELCSRWQFSSSITNSHTNKCYFSTCHSFN